MRLRDGHRVIENLVNPMLRIPIALTTLLTSVCSINAEALAPYDLTVSEGLSNPLGFHDSMPRFSWKLNDSRFKARQTAYQMQVASAESFDLPSWDSGKVESDQSVYVEYGGEKLVSRQRAYWRVRYWDQDGKGSEWSEPAVMEMGLLSKDDWDGVWIHQPKITRLEDVKIIKAKAGEEGADVTEALQRVLDEGGQVANSLVVGEGILSEIQVVRGGRPPLTIEYKHGGETYAFQRWGGQPIEFPTRPVCEVPYFRKEFELSQAASKARLYVTARGIFEVEINGQRVTDDTFVPGWTDYHQRIETLTYDVTDLLKEGKNIIGARVGKGWYAGDIMRGMGGHMPEFLAQLEIESKSGPIQKVATDETWTYSNSGPVIKADVYYGEDYDARNEMPGWSTVGFDASGFKPVGVSQLDDDIGLSPKRFHAVAMQETLEAVSVDARDDGTAIFDLGQNMVGWPAINLPTVEGQQVKIRVAEMVNKDGSLYTENYRTARSAATYIPAKTGLSDWSPRFSFFGFRYVEVSGFDASQTPQKDWVRGHVLHTEFESTGKFVSSHEKLNQLQSNIRWGQKGNFLEIPTDCPQRDERNGWTGDAQVFTPVSVFNYDTHAFWMSWLKSVREHQTDKGEIPVIVPNVGNFVGGPRLSPGWCDAIAVIPWELYQRTGDKRALEENFEAMKRYVGLYRERSPNFIGPDEGFADWLHPILGDHAINPNDSRFGGTPRPLIATAYFGYCASICLKVAEILGAKEDTLYYTELVSQIKQAIRQEFLDDNGKLTTPAETQTGYLLFLGFDLVDEDLKPRLAEHLSALVEMENGRLNTGFLGTPLINRVLDDFGHTEQALGVLFTNEYPSWFYSIDQGATTMWERWNSYSHEHGFGDVRMNSFNHYAYGAVGQWIYERLAGLAPDVSAPGYKRIRIQPILDSPLEFAEAEHETRYGKASVRWERDGETISLDCRIPPNTTAVIELPKGDVQWLNAPENVTLRWHDEGEDMFAVLPAGTFQFRLDRS